LPAPLCASASFSISSLRQDCCAVYKGFLPVHSDIAVWKLVVIYRRATAFVQPRFFQGFSTNNCPHTILTTRPCFKTVSFLGSISQFHFLISVLYPQRNTRNFTVITSVCILSRDFSNLFKQALRQCNWL